MRAVVGLSFVLISAVILGVALRDSELLNPNKGTAEAERIRAETAAVVAQNNYEQQRREIELKAFEEQSKQQATVEAQALAARRAKELELLELAVKVGSAIALLLSAAMTYYLICRGHALAQGQRGLLPSASQQHRVLSPPVSLWARFRSERPQAATPPPKAV